MADWQSIILTVAGSGAVFSFLTVLVNQYFSRRRTAAETRGLLSAAHKTDSDADHTSAQTVSVLLGEIRNAVSSWTECQRQMATAEAKAEAADRRYREEAAERERLGAVAESYRLQIEKLQERETELMGQLREVQKR